MNRVRQLLAIFSVLLGVLASAPAVQGQAAFVRWDIISVNLTSGAPFPATSGGEAFALAGDGSKIRLTGSGTFTAPAGGDGTSSAVSGGGTWETFNSGGMSTGNGTYTVTGLVRWEKAPGVLPAFLQDLVGNPVEASAGLVVLRIKYSDGSRGILVVNCALDGTPASVPEGVSASKGFVDYFDIQAPLPVSGVLVNVTLLHVMQ